MSKQVAVAGGTQMPDPNEAQKFWVKEQDFKGKNKIWRCDVTKDGRVEKIIPEKEYLQNKKTGVIKAVYFIWAKPEYFHTLAPNHDTAVEQINSDLARHSKLLEERSKKSGGGVNILEK